MRPNHLNETFVTEITMPCRLGLHTRVAAEFARFSHQFDSFILICRGSACGNGKSILGLLLLGASLGSKLKVEARGKDAEFAIKEIERFFKDKTHCYDSN